MLSMLLLALFEPTISVKTKTDHHFKMLKKDDIGLYTVTFGQYLNFWGTPIVTFL